MQSAHFVTGATGFVGGALVLELLARTEQPIVCLVRGVAGQGEERLWRSLEHAARLYDYDNNVYESIRTRVHPVLGDVVEAGCGVDQKDLPPYKYESFWHSAASLRFEDRYQAEINSINVAGTSNALALAKDLGIYDFNYISTAYVSGQMMGDIPETYHTNTTHNNHYERSKYTAEALVANSGFLVRIFRPSIVIGHSKTKGAINFSGLYGFVRQLYSFQGLMERTQKDFLKQNQLAFRTDIGVPLDLVPIDCVVKRAVHIQQNTRQQNTRQQNTSDLSNNTAHYYHLNNPTPPTTDLVVNLIFSSIDLPHPRLLSSDDQLQSMSWIDEKFNSRIDFYRSYLQKHKVFSQEKTNLHAEITDLSPYKMDEASILSYINWYLDILQAERANLPTSR